MEIFIIIIFFMSDYIENIMGTSPAQAAPTVQKLLAYFVFK